jgi:CheY-like chemotaxis protein
MPAVLIADGDQDLCDLYRELFAHYGWEVHVSGGGLECLTQLRQCLPQLLILDLQLLWGGADGLLAVMRDDPRFARIPVVLTLSEASPEAFSGLGLVLPPVVRALWKPFSLTSLLELVRPELGNGQPESERRKESGDLPSPCVLS